MAIILPGSECVWYFLSVGKLETQSLQKEPMYFASLTEWNVKHYSRNHGGQTWCHRTSHVNGKCMSMLDNTTFSICCIMRQVDWFYW
jgi:hypothetical protein